MLLLLLIIVMATSYGLIDSLTIVQLQTDRQNTTTEALAQAKAALIGYAVSVALTTSGSKRPGDLPCPDIDNDGFAETSCGNAAGSTGQNLRLGRLPWKSLGLPDLRDGNGERLWYAVSNNFKNNTRTKCTSPEMVGCLNSDTTGTITVRDSTGASSSAAAIAVIISPGNALVRQGGATQIRDTANANNPVNYLDIGNGEDNASFVDGGSNGFIDGDVRDANGNLIVNDRIISITYSEIIPAVEKRVAGEVLICLTEYAAKDPSSQGRYPWAAPLNPLAAPSYSDVSDSRFGRLPDTPFAATKATSPTMDDSWTGNCKINSTSGWWLNWKETVFYVLADAYKPVNLAPPAPPTPVCGTTASCLTIAPPSATADTHIAIIVSGRRLSSVAGGQPRVSNSDKGTIANYLEGENATTPPDNIFSKTTSSPIFNDYVLYQ